MERQKTAIYLNICTIAGLIAMALFIWYGIRTGIFVSAEALENFWEDLACGRRCFLY